MIFVSGGRGKKKHHGYLQGKGGCGKVTPKYKRENRAKPITMENRSCGFPKISGFPIPGSVQGQAGQDLGSGLVEIVPAHGSGAGTR